MNSLIFTTSQGHLSIAEGLECFLTENSMSTELIFREEEGLKYYEFLYKHSPSLFSPFFMLSKTKPTDFFLKKYLLAEHTEFTNATVEKFNPKTIFNTSFGFNEALMQAKSEYGFQFVNIVPNPRTFFLQDIAPADVTCVFDEQTKKDAQKVLSNAEIVPTGWFVRSSFEDQYNKSTVRKMLGLNGNELIFLYVSGSEGTEGILDLVLATQHIPDVQLLVACGSNEKLLQKITALAEQSVASLKAIPFTTEIYKYMQAADLVVGKAGPNMLFESVATHTPFFATTHISGLEDGNLNIIEEYQVGFVDENPSSAAQKIEKLVKNPEELHSLVPAVKKLAEYNKSQRKQLLKYLR